MIERTNPWGLTQRQMKILARLSGAESTLRIGAALGIRTALIQTELFRIYKRLGVTTTAAAVRLYLHTYPLS
jgi:DNA-binding CsgD family transcriptional regulator